MDDLLAQYIDGELTDAGAADFLRRLDRDPRLADALRDFEAILTTAEALPQLAAPPHLADDVMSTIERRETRGSRSFMTRRAWWAAAAALLVGLGIGFLAKPARDQVGRVSIEARPTSVVLPASLEAPGPGVEYLTAVHLVYVPTRPDVRSVAIAGSFNGWDPTALPLTRDGAVWSVLLVLEPGAHEYMFIEDGERWITDPRAPGTRHDGFGGSNGVLNVSL